MLGRRAAVVGGGLAGLCAGLALARAGWGVVIIERSGGEPPGGAGLGLDRALLSRVTGTQATRIPVVGGNRPSAAWSQVRCFLLDAVLAHPDIEFAEAVTVIRVRDHAEAGPVTLDTTAGPRTADVVVGADGVYSTTRRFVSPGQPAARYAGYMLWRGLVAETDVPGGLQGQGYDLEIHRAPAAQLVTYCVPGADGETKVGQRRVAYAWYDTSRTRLLRELGCLQGDRVTATLDANELPGELTLELAGTARRWWPSPWGECVAWSVSHGRVLGAPVAEYLPTRLVRGGVALIGDAAHVASPMTGAGFENALLDVAALTSALDEVAVPAPSRALERYERQRLPHARRLVSSGMAWGRYAFRPEMDTTEESAS